MPHSLCTKPLGNSFPFGRTTGACAAAAAFAARRRVYVDTPLRRVSLDVLNGSILDVPIEWVRSEPDGWSAAVVKDAGGDADVTHGMMVITHLRFDPHRKAGLRFRAGEGVGTITRPGLSLPVGEAAINPSPRRMIERALADAAVDDPELVRRRGAWTVTVSMPGGEEIARKTRNERLGIVGGLSILGTTGVVRPFCRKAMRDAFAVQCAMAKATGHTGMIIVPGHIGASAAMRHFGGASERVLEAGNDWAGAVAAVLTAGFSRMLVAGHPGKLGKLAAGHRNTHSGESPPALDFLRDLAKRRDCRPETDASETTEGFFRALDPVRRAGLADALAECVMQGVQAWAPAAAISVWLCDMNGEALGGHGDLDDWGE